jgi:hypothetical protein
MTLPLSLHSLTAHMSQGARLLAPNHPTRPTAPVKRQRSCPRSQERRPRLNCTADRAAASITISNPDNPYTSATSHYVCSCLLSLATLRGGPVARLHAAHRRVATAAERTLISSRGNSDSSAEGSTVAQDQQEVQQWRRAQLRWCCKEKRDIAIKCEHVEPGPHVWGASAESPTPAMNPDW